MRPGATQTPRRARAEPARTMSHVACDHERSITHGHMGVGLAEDDKEVEGMCLQW